MNRTAWKYPALLLIGVGISNLGAWVYFIALNLIILDRTSSAFAVSLLYMLVPVASLITSLWSGSLIDRVDKRKLMMLLDLSRALFIALLPFIDSLFFLYIFVFLINVGSSLFESTSMIYMTKLVSKGNRQRFNALKNFIQSCGFIVGPTIAGLLFIMGSPSLAIHINAVALAISALILFFLPALEKELTFAQAERLSLQMIISDWKETLRFTSQHRYITLVYSLFCVMMIFMSGLDSLEASFATRVLGFSESTYGFLVSIAGIGIIFGSIINATCTKWLRLRFLIGFGAVTTPIGYLLFATSDNFMVASAGFFLLTFALSFANTGFLSFYQNNVPVNLMGRFSGVIHVAESLFIILLTATIGLLAEAFSIRATYIIFSIGFLLIGLLTIPLVFNRSKQDLYEQPIEEEIKSLVRNNKPFPSALPHFQCF
ncbi:MULTISPECIES: MFS transporter [unclassified Exiguobacterium]|uniref:MFS transporter n=1 Tax=unclassified Exiguobacterium TaxID=2644629 RepID=UPI001BEC97D7|nr:MULTISPECIES: MFS transporter [unclassified Exiguobacterium]